MPRTYIKKKKIGYTKDDLLQAVKKVLRGEFTQYAAANHYKIPLTTLHDHLRGKSLKQHAGRPPALDDKAEKELANTIITMEKWGFGLSRLEIMEIVAEYVRSNNIKTPFKGNMPGPDWFINFRKRHGLSIKKAQPVEYLRKKMTDPFIIGEYFTLLEKTLNELNLFDKPHRIWNLDETSLCLDPSKTKVVGKINKPCARTTHGSGKENITVLAGVSANGNKLPPLIVYKGKFVWDTWMADLSTKDYDFEISYASSTKGWMEADIFHNYIEKVVIPHLEEERPVLLIYDGHSTHVDVRVIQLAKRNDITILKLPPHTSHLLQPLDIAVFKTFKVLWDAKLVEWQRKNIGLKMPKNIFAQTLAETWHETKPEVIKNGFRKAGIHPFNADVIPVSTYDPDMLKRYQQKMSDLQRRKNLGTLKQICLEKCNNLFTTHARANFLNENNYLSPRTPTLEILEPNFTANQPPRQNKINIISNVLIKKADEILQTPIHVQPSTGFSKVQSLCTFEELVLRKIQQDKKEITPKKKRVTKGAEVITAIMGKQIIETKDIKKTITKIKKKPKKTNNIVAEIDSKQNISQGPSGLKKNIRKPTVDSSSSESDIIMNVRSDSDIIDFEDFDEDYDKGPGTQKKIEDTHKYTHTFKGKGIEKKSKPKKNEDKENKPEKNKLNISLQRSDRNATGLIKKETGGEDLYTKPNKSLEKSKNDEIEENHEGDIYKIQDSVLVRYMIRNQWKYFIGFVEKEQPSCYTINFLKTVKKEPLKFIVPKKKDMDNVPKYLIVKKIEIQSNNKEYFLCNNEDTNYF